MSACPGPEDVTGVAHGVLASVGCNSHRLALDAYAALTGPGSFLPAALTTCLTIYVALLGYGLLTGSPRLRLAQVSQTGLKIGAVVALTLNWSIFQTLVFNVASEAPFEVGHIFTLAAAAGGGDQAGDDPLTRLEAIHQELTDSAHSLIQPNVPTGGAPATVTAAGAGPQPPAAEALLWMATTLIVGSVGLIALAMVAQAILVALGPAFMLFFLFDATRGLFVGWVRALAAAVIAPVTTWGGLMVCLATLEPWVARLARERAAHAIKVDTISTLVTFVVTFAAAQAVLAIGAVVITSAFSLRRAPAAREGDTVSTANTQQQIIDARFSQSRAQLLAQSLHSEHSQSLTQEGRRLEVFGVAAASAAPGALAAPAAPRLSDTYRRPSPGGLS
ncbi:MAG TPA: type IV secretion system protein [Caulobacteraceae bacterium]|nr:type IV secretion system protein [Caulobacteraceae bacterium]